MKYILTAILCFVASGFLQENGYSPNITVLPIIIGMAYWTIYDPIKASRKAVREGENFSGSHAGAYLVAFLSLLPIIGIYDTWTSENFTYRDIQIGYYQMYRE